MANGKNRGNSRKQQPQNTVSVKSVQDDESVNVVNEAPVVEAPAEPVQAAETSTPVGVETVETVTTVEPRGMGTAVMQMDEASYQPVTNTTEEPQDETAPEEEQPQLASWPDSQAGKRLKEASDKFFLELTPKRPITANRVSELHLSLYSAINYALTCRNQDEGVSAYRRFIQACRTQLNGAMHPSRRLLMIGRATHLTKAQVTAQEYLLDAAHELAATGANTKSVSWDVLPTVLLGTNTEQMVTRMKMSVGIQN